MTAEPLHPDLSGLIERFRGPLVGWLAAHGAREPAELAADVIAEAWIARERFRGSWEDERAVGAWLSGIARNLHRAARRRDARGARAALEVEALAGPAPVDEPEDAALVRAAIARLSRAHATVVVMHHLEGAPLARVAALLGVSERAVEGRLRRARHELVRIVEAMARAGERR